MTTRRFLWRNTNNLFSEPRVEIWCLLLEGSTKFSRYKVIMRGVKTYIYTNIAQSGHVFSTAKNAVPYDSCVCTAHCVCKHLLYGYVPQESTSRLTNVPLAHECGQKNKKLCAKLIEQVLRKCAQGCQKAPNYER